MSKKINISIPNKVRPNLVSLFHKYLSRKKDSSYSDGNLFVEYDEYSDMAEYWDRMFPGWDDDDDDVTVVYPLNTNKKKKGKDAYRSFWDDEDSRRSKHKHKKNKAKLIDINVPYSGEESDFVENNLLDDEYDSEQKEIWFYPDYHCKEDKLEFNSLKEFNDYCESMGYYIGEDVCSDILWRYESHCCLNPSSERSGLLEIMTEHTYGEMFYEACDESELGY